MSRIVDHRHTTITWVERAADPYAPTLAEINAGKPVPAAYAHTLITRPAMQPTWHAVFDLLPVNNYLPPRTYLDHRA